MYVRKFEGDSLDETLKTIKRELGPDAIILKTITNKGLKGAFKKKKIEITAAISEDNYTKKASVERVFNDDQKEEFYSSEAGYMKDVIDTYAEKAAPQQTGYGAMGLNRSVQQVGNERVNQSKAATSNLDDFLNSPVKEQIVQNYSSNNRPNNNFRDEETAPSRPAPRRETLTKQVSSVEQDAYEIIIRQQEKIDKLETKLYDLVKSFEKMEKKEARGLYTLRSTLRSLDISERYIQKIIKRATFDMTEDELDNDESVFEFALKEMIAAVHVEQPIFKTLEKKNTITVLVSDVSCGQSSMAIKMASEKKGSLIVKLVNKKDNRSTQYAQNLLGVEIKEVASASEIASETRKALETNRSVIIDFKELSKEVSEMKKFVEGLKRAFENVEVLTTISAINSEMFNRKTLAHYESIVDGIVVNHLDLCLNFGSLFNISEEKSSKPFKAFGTGEIIPEDFEIATQERILAGIFEFK